MEENEVSDNSGHRQRVKKRIKYKKKRTFLRSLLKQFKKNKSSLITSVVIILILAVSSIVIYSVIDEKGKIDRMKIQERIEKKIKQFDANKNK